MKITFGTDGWRGKIDSEINPDSVRLAAQAFADYLYKRETKSIIRVAVGYDGRKYSSNFAELFSEVLSGNQIEVILSDRIIPTPLLSYVVKAKKLSAGVMITASHNPDKYNGIKFKDYYGGPFLTEETKNVEHLIGKNKILQSKLSIQKENFLDHYKHHINKQINFDLIKSSEIRVLVDSMGGAGQKIIEEFLKGHNIESSTIYGEAKENFFGRSAEPIEKNLKPLSNELKKEQKYSLGIASDGDADRIGIMLENGDWLSAQETILLLTDYVINKKKYSGHIVKTSSVTDKIRRFETNYRKVIDVQVGFKYICEKMIEENIAIGCEESGGYGFKNHIPERDGIYSALLFIEMLASSDHKRLSDYASQRREEFGTIFYDRIDIEYRNKDRENMPPVVFHSEPKSLFGFKVINIQKFMSSRNIINGIKFVLEGESRWILFRASETEPIIRIYAEGHSTDEVKQLIDYGTALFQLEKDY
jgi:phosphomannomutase